jgi:hypothetical protein
MGRGRIGDNGTINENQLVTVLAPAPDLLTAESRENYAHIFAILRWPADKISDSFLDGGLSLQKLEEIKNALRELGLDNKIEGSGQ